MIGHQHQSFQPTQNPVGAPFARQMNHGVDDIALMFVQLLLKKVAQGDGIGSAPGQSRVMTLCLASMLTLRAVPFMTVLPSET